MPDIKRLIERQQAEERIRQAQQGEGKPIISLKWSDHQIVAVGNALHWSKAWKTFVDFLGDYMKDKLGRDWGNAEISKPLADRHTILQWFDALARQRAKHIGEPGEIRESEVTGAIACYFGIAYALYLLDHNVELQDRMIKRLKDAGQFQGAYYESSTDRTISSPVKSMSTTGLPARGVTSMPIWRVSPFLWPSFALKSHQWAYEREGRIVRALTACQPTGHVLRGFPVFVQPIPAGAIRSVTMGERAPLAEQREIYSRLMETDISLSLAAVDNSGFAFREEVIKMAVPYSKVGPWMSPRTAHIFSDLMNPRGDVARWLIKHHAMSKLVNRPV